MYLFCYRKRPNFGDALNDYLWPRFIETPLEKQPGSPEVFVGIGTLLNEGLPPARILHIFGSGLGYGSVASEAMANWKVHFVRGPLTARALNLDPQLAVSDPGLLLHLTENLEREKDIPCAFMPHHAVFSERMQSLCEQAGVYFINPESSCAEVLDQIGRSRRLICSAMHGAIAAEALRVPWLPVTTSRQMLLSKWEDWAASMELALRFHPLPVIWSQPAPSVTGHAVAGVKSVVFRKSLARLARRGRFQLGSEAILRDRLSRMQEHISDFNEQRGNRTRA